MSKVEILMCLPCVGNDVPCEVVGQLLDGHTLLLDHGQLEVGSQAFDI
jgi:hypothetical protein